LWERLIILLVFALAAKQSHALNPQSKMSQYAHTAWRIDDGAFTGAPTSITQTQDGYIWIGTSAGLVRFDGARFDPWPSAEGAPLYHRTIYSLLGASDGSLWIGSIGGLARLKNREVLNYANPGTVQSIFEDAHGKIWITRALNADQRPLCEVSNVNLHCYGTADGLPQTRGQSLVEDNSGDFWLGTNRALFRWRRGKLLNTFFTGLLTANSGTEGISALVEAKDGTIWAGVSRPGPGLGLEHIVAGLPTEYKSPGMEGRDLAVSSLLIDRDNVLWIGTLANGLFRISGQNIDHFNSADGLSSDSVESLYEDHEGNVWAATAKGIDRFHSNPVISFSTREGMSANRADSVLASRDGTIFVSNLGALEIYRDNTITSITPERGLPGHQVTSLLEDHSGKLWMGIDEQLVTYEGGHFHTVRDLSDLGTVMDMTEDVNHDIWVVYKGKHTGLLHIHNLEVIENIPFTTTGYPLSLASDPISGIWLALRRGGLARYRNGALEFVTANRGIYSGMVTSLLADEDGTIWGATENGLLGWKDGTARFLTSANGLPCNSLIGTIRDQHHNLWITTDCGLAVIEDTDLAKWWKHPNIKLKVRVLDGLDGVEPGNPSFEPGISKSPDGRLWWANGFVLQTVDPDRIYNNAVSPPVHLENVIVDQKAYPSFNDLRLPAHSRNIEIDYSAPSFVIPQRVQFRYKLEGRDSKWLDAGTRRQALYTDLKPGTYEFQVIACNNDGIWNNTGAKMRFAVAPAYYQTLWFKSALWLGVAGILWLIYQLRLKQVANRIHANLGERMEERERIARELHDTLLQGFQSLVLMFQGVVKHMPDGDPNRLRLAKALTRADQVVIEGRERVRNLRAEASLATDLSVELAAYAGDLSQQSGIRFTTSISGEERPLHAIAVDEIRRIAHEAITNAFQHSRASLIRADLAYDRGAFRLLVRDDGVGINQNIVDNGRAGHWGLAGMRERAQRIGARLEIRSLMANGTEVELVVHSDVAYQHEDRRNVKRTSRERR
jgi:ligand-binding sensor domain-containing protein/signal transduction histidine kinase